MKHQGNAKRSAVVGLFLALALPTMWAATVRPGGPEAQTAKPQLPHGLRSHGPGADRVDMPAFDGSQAESTAQRVAGGTKISAAAMAGSVNAFALTPDGATAVYIADQDIVGLFELYSTPVDGSAAPTKISAGLGFAGGDTGVALFRISADGSQVAFLADADLGGGANDAYSAPVDGLLAPVRLSTAAQAPVSALGVPPVGATAVFFGSGSGAVEAYRVTLGTAASGVQLSDAGASNPNGNVVAADFSPDGATLLYAADAGVDNRFQWHSVALTAGGPGSDVQLSAAISSVSLAQVTPNSSTLVYAADEDLMNVLDLYSVPLGGGASDKLTPSIAGTGVTAIAKPTGNSRVAYLADQVTAGVTEVFSAQIGMPGSGVRLNSPFAGTQSADVVTVAPDGTVLYEADENTVGTFDLLSVLIDASAAPTTLHGMTPPDNAGSFSGLGTPAVGPRAIYPVIGTTVDLYSVRFDGSAGLAQINDTLAAGDAVQDAFVPPTATRLTAYGVGTAGVTEDLFAAAVRGDLTPEQVNVSPTVASLGVLGYEIAATEHYAVFLQDQDTPGKPELYAQELDSDQDTVGNSGDNCPYVSNIAQGRVLFGQTVLATDGTTFSWSIPDDVRYVRGPLASVATLMTDQSGTLVEASSFTDADVPAGTGSFYLFAVDCDGRSYQTVLGAEPGREMAGLP